MRPIRLQESKILCNTPKVAANVNILVHSTFAHRSAAETGQPPTESTIRFPSTYPPGLKQNRLEKAEISALKLVNSALNTS